MPRTIVIQRVLTHYRRPLFERLHERFGWEIVIAANPPAGTFLDLAKGDLPNYIHRFNYVFPDSNNSYAATIPLATILDSLKPDTVICEFSTRMSTTYQLPSARLRGAIRNYALWSHGWNMGLGFDTLRNRARQYGRLPLMAPADALLTYSEEGAAWLKKWLPWKTIVSIGNTLDIASIWRIGGTARPIRYGTPQLLGVGRLLPDKEFDRLIRVFRRIVEYLPEAALTIIGDGPERERLKCLAGDDLGRCIHMTGAIYEEAMIGAHFLGADALVMLGAIGLSVNHALAYGVPVVAFPRGPHGPHHGPEIAHIVEGVTGYLCRGYSDQAMAETIMRIGAGTSETRRATIRDYAQRHHAIESMVDRFAKVQESLSANLCEEVPNLAGQSEQDRP